MASFSVMMSRQLTLLCLLAVGYLAGKLGMVGAPARKSIGALMVNILVPCSIIATMGKQDYAPDLFRNFLIVMALGFVGETAMYFLSKFLFPRQTGPILATLRYSMVAPNASFIGLPVVSAFYGDVGVFYLAAMLIPMNFFLWCAGKTIFEKTTAKQAAKELILSPVTIAAALSLVLFLTGLRLPGFLLQTADYLGTSTTVLSMIFSGSILAGTNLSAIFSGRVLYASVLRLVAIPLLMLGLVYVLRVPALPAMVTVLIFAMPAAAATAIMSERHGGNATLASHLIALSTPISMFSLPLLAQLMGFIYQPAGLARG